MKGFLAGIYLVIFLASSGNNLFGQQTGKFIRPDKPVVVGQPFQLQYIYWGKEKVDNLSPISIKGFRIIEGPTIYKSKTEVAKTDSTNYRNIVYTLEPLQAGSFIVPAFVSIGKDAGEQLLLEVLSASNVNSPTPKASATE